MNREQLLYVLPYILSLMLSGGIFIYAWRHRRERGATAFTWYVGGQTLYILGFILEMISPDMGTKILWDAFQWLTEAMIVIISFMVFAVVFTESKFRQPRLAWGTILFFPAVFLAFLVTDPIHHLIYANPRLLSPDPFYALIYDYTFVVYVYVLYGYVATFYGTALLIRRASSSHDLYRSQIMGVALGFLSPAISSVLTVHNIQIGGQRDIGPITFGIGNLVVAYSLFRYRMFDVVPIARDSVIENLADPVIVVDTQNRVVDLNPAAVARIGILAADAVGQPIEIVFAAWPHLLARFRDIEQARTEITLVSNSTGYYLEIRISSLYDRRRRNVGRVLMLHDITEHRRLEQNLAQLNGELEQRVRERTADLAEAYDKTLQGWAKALELRDKETEGHSRLLVRV